MMNTKQICGDDVGFDDVRVDRFRRDLQNRSFEDLKEYF